MTFTHEELAKDDLNPLCKKKKQCSYYAEIASNFEDFSDCPDYGPYELDPESHGIPEGGNFHSSIICKDDKIIQMESWGYTDPPDWMEGWDYNQLDALFNALIDHTIKADVKERKLPKEWISEFWELGGVEMVDRKLV